MKTRTYYQMASARKQLGLCRTAITDEMVIHHASLAGDYANKATVGLGGQIDNSAQEQAAKAHRYATLAWGYAQCRLLDDAARGLAVHHQRTHRAMERAHTSRITGEKPVLADLRPVYDDGGI